MFFYIILDVSVRALPIGILFPRHRLDVQIPIIKQLSSGRVACPGSDDDANNGRTVSRVRVVCEVTRCQVDINHQLTSELGCMQWWKVAIPKRRVIPHQDGINARVSECGF